MEAGVTTATRRLRRASIAGLATIATVGGGLALTGGTALAFQTATAGSNVTLTSGGNATVSVGGSGQTLSDLTLTFPSNASAEEYQAGEQITFWLDSDGADAVNSGSNTLNTASFASAPTVSANNGVAASAATVALTNVNGANDGFTLTFNADAPENANATHFTITGLKVNIGSKVAAGQNLDIDAQATVGVNKSIFWTGTAASDSTQVQVGSLPLVGVTASKVAVAAPGDDANLGTISIKDVTGGNLQAGDSITLTLNNGTWVTAPKAAGSPALTSAGPTINGTTPSELDLTIGSTASAAGNTITLTGGVANVTAGGAVTVDFADATNAIALSPTGVQVAVGVAQNRIGGADRFATAGLLYSGTATNNASLGFNGFTSTSVVLTSGTNFPDALSAQYLAAELSTGGNQVGILTTDPATLSTAAQQQILHANGGTIDTVYIVGGPAAVSANVANQLAALHVGNVPTAANISVVRVGGADRYATNNLADLYLGAAGNTTAFVATGAKFADALSIGPAVYATGSPLILTDSATLVDSAKSTLQNLGITHVVIVGGTAAISDAVATAITNLGITIDTRLAGADRTLTAAAVEGYETDASFNGGNPFQIDNVYIARGDNFADALVAGPIAALSNAGAGQGNPILLTGDPNTLGAGIPSVFAGKAADVNSVTALGLTSAISVGTLSAAAASLS